MKLQVTLRPKFKRQMNHVLLSIPVMLSLNQDPLIQLFHRWRGKVNLHHVDQMVAQRQLLLQLKDNPLTDAFPSDRAMKQACMNALSVSLGDTYDENMKMN